MKIAIFQANTIDNQIKENLERFNDILKELDSDTELLVLPEMFTTAFTIDPDYAQGMDSEGLKWMQTIAREKDIAVAGSLFIKENEEFFNRHFFVFPDGSYEYYDKRHLFCLSQEPEVLTQGQERKIVEYRSWKIALFICYDIRFPIWCRNTYDDGVYGYDLAIYIASWESRRDFAWRSLLIGRAIENVSYVVGVNRVGIDSSNKHYIGSSVILDYKGMPLVEAENEKEEIAYHTVDKSALDKFRDRFPFAKDWDKYSLLQ